jgi:hypothetical protein
MKTLRILAIVAGLACGLNGHAQADTRPVVGVAQFSCDEDSPYTGLVTEKVVEMLTNTHRFRVVDRTSRDKIDAELELQKSEAFLDSDNLADQYSTVAAEKMITGHIVKIPVYRITNSNGTTRGFKGSVAFQLKVVDVESGASSEATSFEGKASKECLSPESAVTMAMQSLQPQIYEYFRLNFPLTAAVLRCIDDGTILIQAGKEQGLKVGDKLAVEAVEMLGGKPYPTTIGEAKVKKLAGEDFAECDVSKKTAKAVAEKLATYAKVRCSLIIKK